MWGLDIAKRGPSLEKGSIVRARGFPLGLRPVHSYEGLDIAKRGRGKTTPRFSGFHFVNPSPADPVIMKPLANSVVTLRF